jgi:hypothetical protein
VSRYRTDDDQDLISRLIQLEKRLSRLERTPQLLSSAINTGDMLIRGGSITFMENTDDEVPGQIQLGTDSNVNGEQVISMSWVRNQNVASGYTFFGTDEVIVGQPALRFVTGEGVTDPDLKFNTWELLDKSGDPLITDSRNARRGFGDPVLHYAWNTATFATSTSGTFAEVANVEWYMYHAHMRIRVLVSNDGGSTSELQVLEDLGGVRPVRLLRATTSGALEYIDLIIPRSACVNGNESNGNVAMLILNLRRLSGAGTVRVRVVSMVGIDLSWSEDF